jgi:hypothetical protein
LLCARDFSFDKLIFSPFLFLAVRSFPLHRVAWFLQASGMAGHLTGEITRWVEYGKAFGLARLHEEGS